MTALNLGEATRRIDGLHGSVMLGTDRRRDGEAVTGTLNLAMGEGALLRLDR
jgi:hypothetical protein